MFESLCSRHCVKLQITRYRQDDLGEHGAYSPVEEPDDDNQNTS